MIGWLIGWRAAIRIARRDAWRNKGRSSLIALMIVLPVFAGSAISVIARSADTNDPTVKVAVQLGASVQAKVDRGSPGSPVDQGPFLSSYSSSGTQAGRITEEEFGRRLAAAVPAANQVVTARSTYSRYVVVGDRLLSVGMKELDYGALNPGGPVQQLSGRAPVAPGEVVATRTLARQEKIAVGDRLNYPAAPGGPRTLTVVGLVGGAGEAGNAELIGRSGELANPPRNTPSGLDAGERSYYVTGPAPVTWATVQAINRFGGAVLSRAVVENPPAVRDTEDFNRTDASVVATTVVVVGLVLLQIALMAGPAIAVGARRNERSLALVAATGGQRRHLRAVVLAGSGLIGLVSCITAVVAGAGLGAALLPLLRARFDVASAGVQVHLLDLVGLAAVGTVTTLLAALLPARRVGRMDVVAALTGRRAPSAPKLRVPVTGALLVVVGAVLAWWASGRGRQFPTVLGLAVAEIGLVVGSAALVGLAARCAAKAPFATRFAFRDAARQRGRTAPAVAAVLAAIAGGTTAMVFASSSAQASDSTQFHPLPLGTVSVMGDTGQASLKELRAAEPIVRATLPLGATAITYGPVQEIGLSIDGGDEQCRPNGQCFAEQLIPTIVNPEAGEIFSTDPAVGAALKGGKVVVFDRTLLRPDGTIGVTLSTYSDTGPSTEKASTVPAVFVPTQAPLDVVLMPRTVAEALDIPLAAGQLVARPTGPVSRLDTQRTMARLQQAGFESSVNVEQAPSLDADSAVVMLAFLSAATVVALIGTFTAVGLAAADARPDLGTLAAVGAGPGLRRRLAGAQAGAIVVPAAVLGTLSGLLGGWVLVRLNSQTGGYDPAVWQLVVPWQQGLLTVGLPVLAVVVGFATVRSRLVLVRRLGE